jgi:hypothetical protein
MRDRPEEERPRFVSYFELKEAFSEEGCPVCRLLLKWTRRYLDSLFYEYVNDPGVRQQLRESHGFCNWHAWMAATIDDSPSGIAIIYEHLLKDQIDALQSFMRSIGPRSWWTRLKVKRLRVQGAPLILSQRQHKAACPACGRIEKFFEQDFIETLLTSLSDPEFADSFQLSFGLCLPHIYQAAGMGRDHPNLPILIDVQLQKLGTLRDELKEYIRKLDYRFMAEPRGEEKTAWRRVIELFVGKPEVFGPDRRSPDGATDPLPARVPVIQASGDDLQTTEKELA